LSRLAQPYLPWVQDELVIDCLQPIPSVDFNMFSACKQLKIFYGVVQRIAVNVVNDMPFRNRAVNRLPNYDISTFPCVRLFDLNPSTKIPKLIFPYALRAYGHSIVRILTSNKLCCNAKRSPRLQPRINGGTSA
jgi:hypothetical protein